MYLGTKGCRNKHVESSDVERNFQLFVLAT
jgi:hypothetical protein